MISLSVTGFEPAISRFVAERVIRCATRISSDQSDFVLKLISNFKKGGKLFQICVASEYLNFTLNIMFPKKG